MWVKLSCVREKLRGAVKCLFSEDALQNPFLGRSNIECNVLMGTLWDLFDGLFRSLAFLIRTTLCSELNNEKSRRDPSVHSTVACNLS